MRPRGTATEREVSGARFPLFADCLLLGVLTFLAALPAVTAFAAFTAACSCLRTRLTEDATVGGGAYLARLRLVLRSHPGVVLAPTAVAVVLAADAIALAAHVPGHLPVGVVLGVTTGAGAVIGVRSAARWAPDRPWSAVARDALSRARSDLRGDVLILAALVAALAVVAQSPVLVPLAPGVLALAAVAVEQRGGGA